MFSDTQRRVFMSLDARIGVVPWGLVFVRCEVLRRRCQGSCRVLRQGAGVGGGGSACQH